MPPRKLEYRRPWMAPYQLAAIFCPERYAVVEATTKAGKTVGCMVWLAERAMEGKPGQNFWWVGPVSGQAKIVFRRLKRSLPRDLYETNETELTITLANGATLWFKSADKPDSLYGEDVYAAVIDEASRCKEEAWFAVRTTLTATRGPVRIIGNVKGRQNWAYRLARRAESGEPDMHYAKITAHDAVTASILSREDVEDARSKLPEAVFCELYEAIPSDDGGNPFGMAHIAACVAPSLAPGPAVAWGWDLGKSIDWTVGIGLAEGGGVCAFERFQMPWPATVDRIKALTRGAPCLVDSTGVGDAVVDALLDAGGVEGFKFTPASKQQLMEGLALSIQRRELAYPDGLIRSELDSFGYEYTRTGVVYTAPEGAHDDCVCALALARRKWAQTARVEVGATKIAVAAAPRSAYEQFLRLKDGVQAAASPDEPPDDDGVAVGTTGGRASGAQPWSLRIDR